MSTTIDSGVAGGYTAAPAYENKAASEAKSAVKSEAKEVKDEVKQTKTNDKSDISEEAKSEEADEENPVNLDAMTGEEEASEAEKTEELQQQREEKENELKEKQAELKKLEEERRMLQQEIRQAKANHEDVSDLVARMDEIKGEMSGLREDIAGLQDEIKDIDGQLESLQQSGTQKPGTAGGDSGTAPASGSSPTGGSTGGASPVGGGSGGNGGGGSYPSGGGGSSSPVGGGGSSYPSSGASSSPSTGSSAPAAAANAPTSADLKGDTAQEQIWNYLHDMGLNDIGAAGVMGNIAQESGYSATNVQNSYESKVGSDEQYTQGVDDGSISRDSFVHDSAGYGIVQYTYHTYKEGLYDMAKEKGKSVGDLGVQLEYLSTQVSPELIQKLNSAGSPEQAAVIFEQDFERAGTPNMSARESAARQAYDQFANKGTNGVG